MARNRDQNLQRKVLLEPIGPQRCWADLGVIDFGSGSPCLVKMWWCFSVPCWAGIVFLKYSFDFNSENMAGHSHWANIAFKKGLVDKKRGKLFGKLARYIIFAARCGGGDPAANLSLRYAIDRAKKASMPSDTIERAVKKGTGELETETYDEVLYEGYGPSGVAILCEILTENRNRTAGEIRKMFEVNGGNLGSTGCVAYLFERKGIIQILAKSVTEDRLYEIALEAGASDLQQFGELFEVSCTPDAFQAVLSAIETAKIPTESAEVMRVASNTVDLDLDAARAVLKLMELLEDHDDVQSVTANFNIPESVVKELEATA